MFRRAVVLPLLVSSLIHGFTARAEEPYTVVRDIRYADLPHAKPNLTSLDIYAPKVEGRHPVMVFIHGGGWRRGDKAMVGAKPRCFTEAGFVFVSINYRLSPDVVHPVHVQDVARAIAWLHRHVAKHGGDPERLYVMGHSAGAHLAALVSTDPRRLGAEKLPLSAIKGAVLLDGAGYDIAPLMETRQRGMLRDIYRNAFGDEREGWLDASPVRHVDSKQPIPPMLIIHAGRRPASEIMAKRFAEALRNVQKHAEIYHAADKNHMTLNRELGMANDEPTETVLRFLQGLDTGSRRH